MAHLPAVGDSRANRFGAVVAGALFVLLALPGIGEPFGGFLGYSESWYALVAHNFSGGSLWLPTVAPGHPDFNIPPLFAWLVHAGFLIAGEHEWVARLVAIAGGALGVFALARAAGTGAALLLASTPAWVLLARNVQPDGWAIALSLAAWRTWSAPGSRHSRDGRDALPAALWFGAALLAKPTVLLLPFALFLAAGIEHRGFRWIRGVHVIWATVAALPLLAWSGLQLLLHPAIYLAGLRHGEGAFEWPALTQIPVLLSEMVYAGFPAITLLAPMAIPAIRRDPRLRKAAALVVFGALQFAVMHYHGYYLLAYVPAGAVLAAAVLARRPGLTALLVVLNSLAALVMLGGHKLGRSEIVTMASAARGATFVLTPDAYAAWWTQIERYGTPLAIISQGCVTRAEGPDAAAIVRIPPAPGAAADLHGFRTPHALAFAGWAVAELPDNPHRLAWGPLALLRSPGTRVGLIPLAPELAAAGSRIPPGGSACP